MTYLENSNEIELNIVEYQNNKPDRTLGPNVLNLYKVLSL